MALLRKHLYPSTTYLCLSVPTCAGIRDGHRAATLWPSLVWRVAECGSTGCGALLGAARVAASGLALLGAFIGLELCLFSYWMNSYWGGAVTAIGGALLIG